MGIQQLQILSPYREKGEASSQNLNESIREEVNPELDGKPEVARGSRKFRLYDRVIQLKNNSKMVLYNRQGDIIGKGVFNGDVGLEPIPKLAMNANEFTPDNNSAGKLKQSHVVDSFLLIANQKFAEAIEKRVSRLNDPAACAKVRVALQLLLLLTPGPNMRNIFALFNCLCAAGIPCV